MRKAEPIKGEGSIIGQGDMSKGPKVPPRNGRRNGEEAALSEALAASKK